MLDIRFIRENQELVKNSLKNRALKIDIDGVIKIDDQRRKALTEFEELASQRNKANDEIGVLLKEKKDAKSKISSMKEISKRIGELEVQLKEQEAELSKLLLNIPNLPHASLPIGDASQNKIVRSWGEPRKFNFKPLSHIELCQNLDIVDFNRATKITGSNFILFKGWGAKLERALINFMLDLHTNKHGYTEIFPPFLVNRASMLGTGQLPKMEEDMYKLKDDDLFLIPTAEVPITNMFRDEILEEDKLPIYYTAYTACFRREAGSYGKDTRGLARVHEFDKVEMVKFVKPEDSFEELEKLVVNAEEVLQLLELPYRLVLLATQDLSFSASKCYDLEVYAAGNDKWLEVSSCSNFESFQARRANIRYRRRKTEGEKQKIEYVHTLNGSGVALARTVIAILENYQQEDGSVLIPKILQPYLNGQERIS
ncbi:MAG: serine--tRNA ligase [Candidatus Omnitrophica bacterium]|nr:serine--tRNA ligase [Candidatus Omnitrophota bacterium]MBU4418917.1 serine--tRNA ligase [Candidatus Omnitrophota bacterium]MBU4467918.1 serine--tRNA ligase [Candidatus Omnitrophota bacterium]MCG2695357.1 serine--tRNA ligase [Candidatus Parcubacteria bacterium]MCG2713391.1 serine--tRNA ligase [Candidatus Omnitrophota bacterium]